MLRTVTTFAACVALSASAAAQLTESEIAPSSPDSRRYGRSVDLDGARGVAGATDVPTGPFLPPGRAFVFERADAAWTTVAALAAPNPSEAYGDAVAVSGDVAVVGDAGAPADTPEAATAVGAAHVFTFDGIQWSLAQSLQSGIAGDGFGRSVAVDGETIVVGAPDLPPGALAPSSARVYRRTNGVWTKVADLLGLTTAVGDRFGAAVGIHGPAIAVGAPHDDAHGGTADVFEESGGVWSQTAHLAAGPLAGSAHFGEALAVHGGRVLVGAPDWSGSVGAAILYEDLPGIGWNEAHVFQKGPFGAAFDRFGADVDLDGERVVIGTPGESLVGPGQGPPVGVAYVGVEDGGAWSLHRIEPESVVVIGLGSAVAISGPRVAAGNPTGKVPGRVQVSFVAPAGEALDANTDTLSVSGGGTQALLVDLPAAVAGHTFLFLGSLSGASPGLPLPNGGTLALNPDPYFFFTFANPTAGLLAPGTGTLDGAGNAAGAFFVPAGAFPTAVGLTLHHAAVVFAPGTFEVTGATNSVPITFVP